uniref:Uncharacterized protein n=1 Tax=Molossus molossus TaxID=27622 RepID=A0A7J8DBY6_MOLMO|nr:hypothetical protein HJG59_009367 [Molossus molossus]
MSTVLEQIGRGHHLLFREGGAFTPDFKDRVSKYGKFLDLQSLMWQHLGDGWHDWKNQAEKARPPPHSPTVTVDRGLAGALFTPVGLAFFEHIKHISCPGWFGSAVRVLACGPERPGFGSC